MRDQGDHAHLPSPDSAPQARQVGTPADPALPQRTPPRVPPARLSASRRWPTLPCWRASCAGCSSC